METMAANNTPRGCGPAVDSLYYKLCDLDAAWGVVLEALAAAGVVFTLVLFISLLAGLPFVKAAGRRSGVPLHAGLLVFTAGLFGLTFAFIVGRNFATCTARRFLFGVLFAGCFSCLLMQSVRVNVLARRGGGGPPAWALCLGAAALWLVEVVINTEWLLITAATSCDIANQDFVMALIYVMALMLAGAVAALASMAGKQRRWRREGLCILLSSVASLGIWVAWIAMYVHGNQKHGGPTWDDPTLAIALVTNAWVFLVVYTIPDVCCLPEEEEEAEEQRPGRDLIQNHSVGYETILKEQGVSMENKAFSMDEPHQGSKHVSPYSGYTGQLRSSVYQPTELALITKANRAADPSHNMIIPRASANLAEDSAGGSLASRTNGNNGNGLHRTSQW